jgi:hypothetical protein
VTFERRPFDRRWATSACLAALVAVRAACAADATSHAGGEPLVQFRADRLELDPELSRLSLQGHVFVAVDRIRLRSDRLSLRETNGAVIVEGSGRVALCGCADPPVTFGFAGATVRPPGDLVLSQPTVRVGGVPVLWLPVLWLRSPERVGLLPLVVAWRGADGLLLGSGVHVPAGDGSVDLSGAGYVEGGADVEARVRTARTSSVVRWDRRGSDFFTVDLRGSGLAPGGGSVSWSADALRGPRALGGPSLLEVVALRDDRASNREASWLAWGRPRTGLAEVLSVPRSPVQARMRGGAGLSVTSVLPTSASTWRRFKAQPPPRRSSTSTRSSPLTLVPAPSPSKSRLARAVSSRSARAPRATTSRGAARDASPCLS